MIPMLAYAPKTNNQRVTLSDVPGDESARIFNNEEVFTPSERQEIIQAAYLQIYHQQQMLQSNRAVNLESQFKNGQLTVRDFIRGLLLSDSFRRLNFDANDNYRFVELCIQRVLGREVYSVDEKLSWSIVLATKGLVGFVDQLLNSDEYLENFGPQIVPYHRKRVLPQRVSGELPFQRMARYGANYRNTMPGASMRNVVDLSTNVYRRIIVLPIAAGIILAVSVFVDLVL
ncbi:MAG: phycobilisome rod-core linker polypeptide [Cyanobacteria bacterium P01_F01_bin.42]